MPSHSGKCLCGSTEVNISGQHRSGGGFTVNCLIPKEDVEIGNLGSFKNAVIVGEIFTKDRLGAFQPIAAATAESTATGELPPLDGVLMTALGHPRDRLLLLKAEITLKEFVEGPSTRLPLTPPAFPPSLNSYHRLLLHRLSDRYGITREVEGAPPGVAGLRGIAGGMMPGTGLAPGMKEMVVVLVKGDGTRLPSVDLVTYSPSLPTSTPLVAQPPSAASPSPPSSTNVASTSLPTPPPEPTSSLTTPNPNANFAQSTTQFKILPRAGPPASPQASSHSPSPSTSTSKHTSTARVSEGSGGGGYGFYPAGGGYGGAYGAFGGAGEVPGSGGYPASLRPGAPSWDPSGPAGGYPGYSGGLGGPGPYNGGMGYGYPSQGGFPQPQRHSSTNSTSTSSSAGPSTFNSHTHSPGPGAHVTTPPYAFVPPSVPGPPLGAGVGVPGGVGGVAHWPTPAAAAASSVAGGGLMRFGEKGKTVDSKTANGRDGNTKDAAPTSSNDKSPSPAGVASTSASSSSKPLLHPSLPAKPAWVTTTPPAERADPLTSSAALAVGREGKRRASSSAGASGKPIDVIGMGGSVPSVLGGGPGASGTTGAGLIQQGGPAPPPFYPGFAQPPPSQNPYASHQHPQQPPNWYGHAANGGAGEPSSFAQQHHGFQAPGSHQHLSQQAYYNPYLVAPPDGGYYPHPQSHPGMNPYANYDPSTALVAGMGMGGMIMGDVRRPPVGRNRELWDPNKATNGASGGGVGGSAGTASGTGLEKKLEESDTHDAGVATAIWYYADPVLSHYIGEWYLLIVRSELKSVKSKVDKLKDYGWYSAVTVPSFIWHESPYVLIAFIVYAILTVALAGFDGYYAYDIISGLFSTVNSVSKLW
ncbi:hypothetical protein MNV49_003865 [Pseudohyphozyma bogoriensis]|nr:hypothetical protein MNV49_003865 [Pseudohyphozyma bogoriensis]